MKPSVNIDRVKKAINAKLESMKISYSKDEKKDLLEKVLPFIETFFSYNGGKKYGLESNIKSEILRYWNAGMPLKEVLELFKEKKEDEGKKLTQETIAVYYTKPEKIIGWYLTESENVRQIKSKEPTAKLFEEKRSYFACAVARWLQYNQYLPEIFGMNRKAFSEDFAQEIWTKLFLKIDSYKYFSSLNTWLYKIMQYHFLGLCRKQKNKPRFVSTNDPVLPGDADNENMLIEDTIKDTERIPPDRMAEIVERLSQTRSRSRQNKKYKPQTTERRREVIDLAGKGYKHREIAETLKIPMGTVATDLRRAQLNCELWPGYTQNEARPHY